MAQATAFLCNKPTRLEVDVYIFLKIAIIGYVYLNDKTEESERNIYGYYKEIWR